MLADRYGTTPQHFRFSSQGMRSATTDNSTGPLNTLIPATLLTAIVTYAWPFATNVPAFIVIAVLFGQVLIFRSSSIPRVSC